MGKARWGARGTGRERERVSWWGRDGRVAPCTDLATILECHVRGEKGEARTNYTVHWRERGAGVRRCAGVMGGEPKG